LTPNERIRLRIARRSKTSFSKPFPCTRYVLSAAAGADGASRGRGGGVGRAAAGSGARAGGGGAAASLGGGGAGGATPAAVPPFACSWMNTRASSRDGKSIGLPHFGQLKRAWTGGMRSREIEKLEVQLGQTNV
jgi:hypothetical protein